MGGGSGQLGAWSLELGAWILLHCTQHTPENLSCPSVIATCTASRAPRCLIRASGATMCGTRSRLQCCCFQLPAWMVGRAAWAVTLSTVTMLTIVSAIASAPVTHMSSAPYPKAVSVILDYALHVYPVLRCRRSYHFKQGRKVLRVLDPYTLGGKSTHVYYTPCFPLKSLFDPFPPKKFTQRVTKSDLGGKHDYTQRYRVLTLLDKRHGHPF
jgi:hypothetical protein